MGSDHKERGILTHSFILKRNQWTGVKLQDVSTNASWNKLRGLLQ